MAVIGKFGYQNLRNAPGWRCCGSRTQTGKRPAAQLADEQPTKHTQVGYWSSKTPGPAGRHGHQGP